jgi:hypothetical protein
MASDEITSELLYQTLSDGSPKNTEWRALMEKTAPSRPGQASKANEASELPKTPSGLRGVMKKFGGKIKALDKKWMGFEHANPKKAFLLQTVFVPFFAIRGTVKTTASFAKGCVNFSRAARVGDRDRMKEIGLNFVRTIAKAGVAVGAALVGSLLIGLAFGTPVGWAAVGICAGVALGSLLIDATISASQADKGQQGKVFKETVKEDATLAFKALLAGAAWGAAAIGIKMAVMDTGGAYADAEAVKLATKIGAKIADGTEGVEIAGANKHG